MSVHTLINLANSVEHSKESENGNDTEGTEVVEIEGAKIIESIELMKEEEVKKDDFIPVIHALIPARGGSKGIKRKNIRLFRGEPLIAHSIRLGLASKYISRVVVTTDDEEIAEVARKYGADVPFLRPKEISGDLSTDYEFFAHYIAWLRKKEFENNEGDDTWEIPDLLMQLRPTFPLRTVELLNDTIEQFIKPEVYNRYYSLRTVIPIDKSPFKMYRLSEIEPELIPIYQPKKDEITEQGNEIEFHNMPRQILPQCYLHNGCIDIVKRDTIELFGSVSGFRIYPYIMDKTANGDIDTEEDWLRTEEKI